MHLQISVGLLAILASLTLTPRRANAQNNEVLIIGRPRSTEIMTDTGRSIQIRPRNSSEFEANSHIRSQSSMQLQETGSTSASGFSLPRIRGHDYRLTRTTIEDITIYDPDLNLPGTGEIDLRAFGEMNLDYGVPGLGQSGVTPVGGVRLYYAPVEQPQAMFGAKIGDVYGQSYFTSLNRPVRSEDGNIRHEARLFARRHLARGDYPYYSDESTPYNIGDDRILRRQNNQSQSLQLIPSARFTTGLGEFRVLSLIDQSERGLASSSSVISSMARERLSSQTLTLALDHPSSRLDQSQKTVRGLRVLLQNQSRHIADPTSYYFPLSRQANSDLKTWQVAGLILKHQHSFVLGLEWKSGQANTSRSTDDTEQPQLRRAHSQAEITAGWKADRLKTAAKANWKWLEDTSNRGADQLNAQRSEQRQRHLNSTALVSNLSLDAIDLYAQIAKSLRPPSLSEEFGDGSVVLQSDGLEAESMIHLETGALVRVFANRLIWSIGIFQDRVKNKISLVPALANSLRAINLRHAEISGLELSQIMRSGALEWHTNYTRLQPLDTTTPERNILPSTPQWQASTSFSLRYHKAILKWASIGRSKVFRDASNQIEIPSLAQHDLHLDYAAKARAIEFRIGAAIKNLMDVKSAPISAGSSGSNHGRTAVADFAGAPLPGRSVTFYVESEFEAY